MSIKELTYEELFNSVTEAELDIELEKIYPCSDIEIETPDGWISIIGVMKKIGKGVRITTESGKVFHGEEKHLIMGPDGWQYLKDADVVLTKENDLEKVVSKEYTNETTFYDISIPPPHAYYSPNGLVHHNTWVVTDTINKEGLAKGKDWYTIKGKITTSSLYQTLFIHREGGLLVFDDTDSVWNDSEAANILKAALDSYDERVISWVSPRTVNVSKMSDEEKVEFNAKVDDRMLTDPDGKGIRLPSEFIFDGRIIFISNLTKDKFDDAVLSRSAKIDMTLTQDQIFDRMKGILEHLGDAGVPMDIKEEILDFLRSQSNMGLLTGVSMRTYVAAEQLYKSGLPNWRELLDYV